VCGISVILDPRARADVLQRLRAMHEPIRHRGPDGEGVLLIDPALTPHRFADFRASGDAGAPRALAGFAFRRLSILDLSDAASQPMASHDGRIWIVFNGEIYNFAELRRELESEGHVFRSSGDTAVIVAAYERWGTKAFARLEGMWAIVIADLRERKLVASRDRFGIKPLYWSIDDDRLYLASEAKQIVAARGGRPRANAAFAVKMLHGARTPNLYETFFDGIEQMPPATTFEMPLDGVSAPRFVPYWQLPESAAANPSRYQDAVDELEAILRGAVASHSVADVATGALLSGGLDSSTIAAMAKLPTFSFGFSGEFESLSELEYSRAVVASSGLENHETTFDAAWVKDNIGRAIHSMEEPPLALAPLAQFRIFQFCRERGMTVILDGQGADEILGGYPYHERLLILDRLRRRRWREAYSAIDAVARRQEENRFALAFESIKPPILSRYRKWFRAKPYDWLTLPDTRKADLRAYVDRGRDPSMVNRQVYWDIKWGNVRIILDYADKNAMHSSIEARVPFFDRRLVELAMSLPDTYKTGNGDRKRVLRDVGRRMLPPKVTERRTRQGFATPDEALVRGPLRESIESDLHDSSFSSLPIFRKSQLEQFLAKNGDFRATWRLWALARWITVFDATF